MTPGTRVRMTEGLKDRFRAGGCQEHVDEFGECQGIVEGLVQWPGGYAGPEVEVRWQPSGLRYGYHPDDLQEVTDGV